MKNSPTWLLTLFIFFILGASMYVAPVFTSALTGMYAWSDEIGWINFNATNGGVTVSSSAVTGYAWSEAYGWINLSPTTEGVANTASGTLSGYAWGQTAGWINFSGVTISCSGVFAGTATGDVVGTINFSCANCSVSTSWRPTSGCGTSSGGGDGGHPPTPPPTPPAPPPSPPPTPTPPPLTPTLPPSPAPPSAPNPAPSGPGGGGVAIIENSPVQPALPLMIPARTIQDIKKIVNIPAVSNTIKVVSTAGAVSGGIIATFVIIFSPSSIFEIFLIPFRLLTLVLAGLGLRRKRISWGVVYDSQTKQPLDPAYVVLEDLQGKDVTSAITDLDGRYGFLAAAGMYKMVANKTNYAFPSQKLAGKTNDEIYQNLYFGENIEVKNTGEAIIKNIPLDPVKFDWNEFAKKNKNLMKFYSKWNGVIIKITDIFFVIGFGVAIVAFFAAPYPYNSIILGFYLLFLLLRTLGLKPKPYGFVIDSATNIPLPFAIIRILDPATSREITYKISDKYGRYYCLLPNGTYYVKIEKKQEDGSYVLAYTSQPITIGRKGILKEKFNI